MTRRRRLVAAGAAALVAVAAAAAVLASVDGDDPAPARPSEPTPGEGPVDGGTLRVGLAGPLAIDPARASPASPGDMLVVDLLHRGLTELDAGGRAVPALAASWTADPEQRTWRFTLDREARFTSGRPVLAGDVVASLQRVIAGGDTSLAALRLEDVQGVRAYLDGTAPEIAGLRVVDATTVEVALDVPLAVLPELLAAPPYGIVDTVSLSAAVGASDAVATAAISALDLSGGWDVDDGDPGRLLLTRRSATPGHLEAVELRSFPDASAAFDAFEDGDVDWAPVPGDRLGDAVEAHGDDHFTPFQAELFLGLRVSAPALDRQPLRQAIAAAVDADAIARAVYPDLADRLVSIVPAGLPGDARTGAGDDSAAGRNDPPCHACGHDPARARALVAEAFPDGAVPTLTIDTEASAPQEALARIVAEDLDAVGIPTEVRSRPLLEYQRFIVSGAQQLFMFGWVGGYASPDAYLTPLFRSASVDNLVGLASPDVDALLAEARAAPDPAVRADRWAAVERQLLDAAVVVPIVQFRTQVVVAEAVQGLRHAVDGTVDWSAVWLADPP